MSELIKRIIVAIIGIPLAIAIIYYGSWFMFVFIAILSVLAQLEYYQMAEKKHSFPVKFIGIAVGFLFLLSYQLLGFISAMLISAMFFSAAFILIMIFELWNRKPNAGLNIATSITGFIYIPLSFLFVLLIRNFYDIINSLSNSNIGAFSVTNTYIINSSGEGAGLLLSILISIWICDSGAYFVGKAFGKHKLFERISPKKTWEGAIGGYITGILGFWGASTFLLENFDFIHVIVIGSIVGTIGQIGDLAESQLKRDAGVKDSSAILPGHGGILDRFDSILFVMPIVFIYLLISSLSFSY